MQEVLRYLVEEGLVVWRGDHWEGRWRRTEEALPEAGIPGGLRDVIGKRFSRLSPSCAQLLGVASVIGRDFPLDVLLGVAGLSEEDVFAGLEEARDLALLEEISAPGALTYRFGHALFRQTLYEDLLAPRRLRLHQQVARALEEKYADRLEEHSAELAGHYAHSTDKDDLAKAITYFRMAATRDIGVYAYAEASEHLEQALAAQQALDSRDRSSRCDLLLALGEVLMPSGEPLRVAEELAEGAFSLAEALRDEERAAAACRLALNALNRYGAVSARSGTQWQKWAGRIDRYAPAGTVSRVYADLAVGSQWGAQGWARSLGALELARQLGEPEATFQCARQLLLGGRLTHWEESLALAEEFAVRP